MEANKQVITNSIYMRQMRSIISVTREVQGPKARSISTSIQQTRPSPITSIKRQTPSTLTCDRSLIQLITRHMDKQGKEETMLVLTLTQMLHQRHSIRIMADSASTLQAD